MVVTACSKLNEKVKVDVFAVSACPFIIDMEAAAEPFLDEMGEQVEFNMYYYGIERSPGNFSSFHGTQEPFLNILELCIIEKNKVNYQYMHIINCLNHRVEYQEPDSTIPALLIDWETCTDDRTSANNEAVNECAAGEEGNELYRKSIKYIRTIKDAKYPPLLLINGKRVPSFDDLAFKIEVCKYLDSTLCNDLPECSADANCPVKEGYLAICENNKCEFTDELTVIVLKDPNNNDPAYFNTDIIEWFSLYLGYIKAEYVDPQSEEGKELSERFGIKEYPALLFDESIENTYAWKKEEDLLPFILREKKFDKYVYRRLQYLSAQEIFNGVREEPYLSN